jgi:hypothetical protein
MGFTKKKENGAHSAKNIAVLQLYPHKEAILSIALNEASGKPDMPIRYRPSLSEGHYIRYKTNLAGTKLTAIARSLNTDRSTVSKVIRGLRRSARIEAEIARILGKADWNEVVLEARSEVQKKPVKAILEEMRQAREDRKKAQRESLGAAVSGREIEVADRRRRA